VKLAIGCDHGGFDLKQEIVEFLRQAGHEILDLGCKSHEAVDYPHFAELVCQAVLTKQSEAGILICGTGIGMSMAANRHQGIRAALCHETYTARKSREHNDANVLCLGARVLGGGVVMEIVKVWVETEFAGGRHLRRIEMF
jgi:ribose 5-phosphate isomerase B